MRSTLTIAMFILFLTSHIFAQTGNGKITGSVKDEKNKPIDAATISLLHSDSSLAKVSVSNSLGEFEFENISFGTYRISITAVGFLTYQTEAFDINTAHSIINLNDIPLHLTSTSLEQVTVTSQKPFIEQKIDRMIVNVDAAVTNVGATALEVLEKSPGVSVDRNGNISLKGKQGVTIMLDGKPTYLS